MYFVFVVLWGGPIILATYLYTSGMAVYVPEDFFFFFFRLTACTTLVLYLSSISTRLLPFSGSRQRHFSHSSYHRCCHKRVHGSRLSGASFAHSRPSRVGINAISPYSYFTAERTAFATTFNLCSTTVSGIFCLYLVFFSDLARRWGSGIGVAVHSVDHGGLHHAGCIHQPGQSWGGGVQMVIVLNNDGFEDISIGVYHVHE
mgnify:CR=1 FL=1